MGMAGNIEHTHVSLHRWLVWPTPAVFFRRSCRTCAVPKPLCGMTGFASKQKHSFFFSRPPNGSSHIPDVIYSAGEWQCSPGDLDVPPPPNHLSPGHSIVLHSASIHPFGESSITAALYSIIVTLIKAPSPDPFPEWNVHPLPQPWDNGPCYRGEQGPTVSRLLVYSPGLITLALLGTLLLEKALALGSTR